MCFGGGERVRERYINWAVSPKVNKVHLFEELWWWILEWKLQLFVKSMLFVKRTLCVKRTLFVKCMMFVKSMLCVKRTLFVKSKLCVKRTLFVKCMYYMAHSPIIRPMRAYSPFIRRADHIKSILYV